LELLHNSRLIGETQANQFGVVSQLPADG